jgi:hypothetical protein
MREYFELYRASPTGCAPGPSLHEGPLAVVKVVEHQWHIRTDDGELDGAEAGAASDDLHPDVRKHPTFSVSSGRSDIPVSSRNTRPDVRFDNILGNP